VRQVGRGFLTVSVILARGRYDQMTDLENMEMSSVEAAIERETWKLEQS